MIEKQEIMAVGERESKGEKSEEYQALNQNK